jgi:hypothetical protein
MLFANQALSVFRFEPIGCLMVDQAQNLCARASVISGIFLRGAIADLRRLEMEIVAQRAHHGNMNSAQLATLFLVSIRQPIV